MKRRSFLKKVGSAAAAATALDVSTLWGAKEPLERVEGLPRRSLGGTGKKISVVGFPGLALIHCDQDKATASIHNAFDRGLNYFDVAPASAKPMTHRAL